MRVIKKLLSNYNWFLTLGEVSPVMEMSSCGVQQWFRFKWCCVPKFVSQCDRNPIMSVLFSLTILKLWSIYEGQTAIHPKWKRNLFSGSEHQAQDQLRENITWVWRCFYHISQNNRDTSSALIGQEPLFYCTGKPIVTNISDPRLTSSWNKTWKKNSVWDLNPWPLKYRCSALPTELIRQLSAVHLVGSKLTYLVVNTNCKCMKIIKVCCGRRNECKRSSQLWALLN